VGQRQCSFCGKHDNQVEQLIVGPGVFICDGCVALCQAILAETRAPSQPQAPPDDSRGGLSHDQPAAPGLTREALRSGLDALAWRERRVLQLRYGLGGERPQTLDDVGRSVGLTPEAIRQIEADSLKKLRPPAAPQP
jgi:hypothetical protein